MGDEAFLEFPERAHGATTLPGERHRDGHGEAEVVGSRPRLSDLAAPLDAGKRVVMLEAAKAASATGGVMAEATAK